MCKDCGCGDANRAAKGHGHDHGHDHPHEHAHGYGHTHSHPHAHPHTHEDVSVPHDHADHVSAPASVPAAAPAEVSVPVAGTRTIAVERQVLARNDEIAVRNREWLTARGIIAVNLISSPGAGKTLLLERTLDRLNGRIGCAVITGDVQTDHDARRLANRGAQVSQIETRNSCHLSAAQIRDALPDVIRPDTRLLFIENVGNLVCPAAFDLGEHFKIALLSATEGEDKPAKYPTVFSEARVVVLTKMDLAPHLDWDLGRCRQYIRSVHPGIFVFELSAKTGEGMDAWIDYLAKLVA